MRVRLQVAKFAVALDIQTGIEAVVGVVARLIQKLKGRGVVIGTNVQRRDRNPENNGADQDHQIKSHVVHPLPSHFTDKQIMDQQQCDVACKSGIGRRNITENGNKYP